jgi:hypothetical protein
MAKKITIIGYMLIASTLALLLDNPIKQDLNAQPQQVPGKAVSGKYLSLSDLEFRQDKNSFSNQIIVSGLVSNNSTQEVSLIWTVLELYDAQDRLLTVGVAPSSIINLKTGQDSPFSVTANIGQDDEVAHYTTLAGGSVG